MFNPCVKFDMSTITCNKEMKGNAKCKDSRFEPPFGDVKKVFVHGKNSQYMEQSESVIAAETTNCFRNRLDKFWNNQEMIFNYKAELTGIGNRSNIK